MSRGFTLLETLVGVFLLTLLAGIVWTTIATYCHQQTTNLVQQRIVTDLGYAQTLAQTIQNDSDIVFQETGYTITAADTIKRVSLMKGYAVSTQHLGYTPQGTPKYSRTVVLSYRNQPVSKLTVAVGSGLLRWQNL